MDGVMVHQTGATDEVLLLVDMEAVAAEAGMCCMVLSNWNNHISTLCTTHCPITVSVVCSVVSMDVV